MMKTTNIHKMWKVEVTWDQPLAFKSHLQETIANVYKNQHQHHAANYCVILVSQRTRTIVLYHRLVRGLLYCYCAHVRLISTYVWEVYVQLNRAMITTCGTSHGNTSSQNHSFVLASYRAESDPNCGLQVKLAVSVQNHNGFSVIISQ